MSLIQIIDILLEYWEREKLTHTGADKAMIQITRGLLVSYKDAINDMPLPIKEVKPKLDFFKARILEFLKENNDKQYVLHLDGINWEKLQKMLSNDEPDTH